MFFSIIILSRYCVHVMSYTLNFDKYIIKSAYEK